MSRFNIIIMLAYVIFHDYNERFSYLFQVTTACRLSEDFVPPDGE